MKDTITVNGLKITPPMFEVFEFWFNNVTDPIDSAPVVFVDVLIEVQDMLTDMIGEDIDNSQGKNRKYQELITILSSLRRDFKKITPNHEYYE
jgi:hypothetical protein